MPHNFLGNDLILSNLRWQRSHSHLLTPASADQFGHLKYGFIAQRIEYVAGESWSTSKIRELFGSRSSQRGAPAYRWVQLLILAEALEVSLLDLIVPDREDVSPAELEGTATQLSEAMGLPQVLLSPTERKAIQTGRRYEILLREAIAMHPQMTAASLLLNKLQKDGDLDEQADSAIHTILRQAFDTIKAQITAGGLQSPLLVKLVNDIKGDGYRSLTQPSPLDWDQARQILTEFGVYEEQS